MSDDWTLTEAQADFMDSRYWEIVTAYDTDDMPTLRAIAASDEYKALFGDMSWDEAYDRFECLCEEHEKRWDEQFAATPPEAFERMRNEALGDIDDTPGAFSDG